MKLLAIQPRENRLLFSFAVVELLGSLDRRGTGELNDFTAGRRYGIDLRSRRLIKEGKLRVHSPPHFLCRKRPSVVVSYFNLFYHIWGLKSIKILVFFVAIGEEYDCKRSKL